jgi:hypothetical protein
METTSWAASCRRILLAGVSLAVIAAGAGVGLAAQGRDGNRFRALLSTEGPGVREAGGHACGTTPLETVIEGTGANSLVITQTFPCSEIRSIVFDIGGPVHTEIVQW